jgi:hypothetical protein
MININIVAFIIGIMSIIAFIVFIKFVLFLKKGFTLLFKYVDTIYNKMSNNLDTFKKHK